MAPITQLPAVDNARILQVRDTAQQAMHDIWESGNQSFAREVYWMLRAHFGGHAYSKQNQTLTYMRAHYVNQLGPINAYLVIPTDQLKKAKAAVAPPRVKPDQIKQNLPDALKDLPGAGVLTDVPGFLSALTQRNTWLRIGEGVLGLMLIGIGVAALTKGTPVGAALRTAMNATPAGKVTRAIS